LIIQQIPEVTHTDSLR